MVSDMAQPDELRPVQEMAEEIDHLRSMLQQVRGRKDGTEAGQARPAPDVQCLCTSGSGQRSSSN